MLDKVYILEVLTDSGSAYNQVGEVVRVGVYRTMEAAHNAAQQYDWADDIFISECEVH